MGSKYGANLAQASAQASTAQTNASLVAAITGKTIKVAYIFVMVDTATTVTLESGNSTRKWELYPAANGGATVTAPPGEFLFECAAGDALTYTTADAVNVFVSVLYTVV